MPQAASIAASAAATGQASGSASSRPSSARPVRLTSSGSFHAGAPIPNFRKPYDNGGGSDSAANHRRSIISLRRQSTHRYHTFPTQPPKTPRDAPDSNSPFGPISYSATDDGTGGGGRADGRHRRRGHRHTLSGDSSNSRREQTPLPIKQLGLLALLSLCEQTALNSIGPYLPTMVRSFPEIPDDQAGLYVGLLASAFAMAQLCTNFLWGYFSDHVGRKPTMLLGTALLVVCFAFFGFCASYWQLLVVHVAMGLLNGNAAVVPTVLGEVTDRSNQSKAFTWLPVMYSIGGITGPALGGLLVNDGGDKKYPFLAPNIMSAAILLAAVIVLAIWFEETLDDAERQSARSVVGLAWVEKLCGCGCLRRQKHGRKGSWSSRWPTSGRENRGSLVLREDEDEDRTSDEDSPVDEERALLNGHDLESQQHGTGDNKDNDESPSRRSTMRELLNWTTLTILFTYLIFQVANISFNSLYPIFASSPPPTGRDLSPGSIGVSMSFAGLVTILFQVTAFEPLKARLGNLGTFRLSLLGLGVSMFLMPWVGYQDGGGLFGWGTGRTWLFGELGVVLLIKNVCAVGGLSCVLLLVSSSFFTSHLPCFVC